MLEFLRACCETPELHFDFVEKQLDIVQQDLNHRACAGDVFITRHSNLSSVHVVFHLLAGGKSPF